MVTDDPDRLESWKEIAAFLGRDERTAMRWAARQGMPIHRVPGGKRGRVFASREEISKWLGRRTDGSSQNIRTAGESRQLTYVAAGVLAALALLLFALVFRLWWSRAGQLPDVTRVTFTSDSVVGWHDDHQLWQYKFPRPLAPVLLHGRGTLEGFVRLVDLNHGRRRVVVLAAPFKLGLNPDSPFEFDIDGFSDRGKLLWSYVAHEKFQFGRYELRGPWNLLALYLSDSGPRPSIWVAEAHRIWGNTFLMQLDAATGRAKLRFVNTGVLYCMDEVKTPRGTYMLAGGFNNEYSSGIMAVINEKTPFAVSPQTPGTRHQCVSCATGAPAEYFVLPRTEINRFEGSYDDGVRWIAVDGDRIEIKKSEDQFPGSITTFYTFRTNPRIQPASMRYDSSYDMLYRKLEKEGKIRYTRLADAPERLHPLPVSVWTPSDGWADYDVRPNGVIASRPRPITKPPRYVLAAGPSPN